MSNEMLANLAREDYLEKIEDTQVMIKNIVGGNCPWWNVSCHLGNQGQYCTISKECMPGCH